MPSRAFYDLELGICMGGSWKVDYVLMPSRAFYDLERFIWALGLTLNWPS